MIRARRAFSAWIARVGTSIRSLSIIAAAGAVIVAPGADAQMRAYKGDLTSRTLVFDVTTVDGGKQNVETWFVQWVGNVYAKSIESPYSGVGKSRLRTRVCESASWIVPKRHIWKEGDALYETYTQDLKYLRLDHSIKRTKCKRVTAETRRVSQGALKRAQAWFGSRQMTSKTIDRDHRRIGNVETWIEENVPGLVSVKLHK